MTELLTSAQMRAIEQAAIASGAVTGLELMERAGQGVVEAVLAEWPELAEGAHRAVVLCGPGNNGGDGFVVARLLKGRGWEVEVFLYGDPGKLPPDARANYERWEGVGEVREWQHCYSNRWFPDRSGQYPLVIDAVFGIGLVRTVPDEICNVLLATLNCRRVAVDVPSVLSSDTGALLADWRVAIPAAQLTVTFHRAKPGHFLADGPAVCGKVVVRDIGVEPWDRHDPENVGAIGSGVGGDFWERQKEMPDYHAGQVRLIQQNGYLGSDVELLRKGRKQGGHKYTHGHALILSGPPGHGGAARLAARGALRIGAGLVTVGCPEGAIPENAARLDAVMLRRVGDGAALAGVLSDRRITALCLGPGLGLDGRAAGLVGAALGGGRDRPPYAVLDADALTLISRDPALFGALRDRCVLTPHGGEFARLFPDIAGKLAEPATRGPAFSKVDATREAAKRAGCVVLFKGPDTVIAGPDGRCAVNSAAYDRAAPWLATAGSGDVLAGFIAGLLARGFAPFEAACTAAWLHVECARSFGPGLIAEDLAEELPKVFRALGV